MKQSASDSKSSYILILGIIFSTCLIISNIASNKLVDLFGLTIDAGFIFFPLTYVINDIVTEVYGFKTSRKIIYSALFANIFAVLAIYFVIHLPTSPQWHNQEAFEATFELTTRIFIASLISYLFGELINAFTLSKMKEYSKGKYMGARFIVSTIIGGAIENTLFYFIAFLGAFKFSLIIEMMMIQYVLKILYEILLLPFSCYIAKYLKTNDT